MQPSLDQIFDEAKQRMLARPADIPARSALWQVLAARGEYERAHKQLDAMVAIDSSWLMEVLSCQGLLQAEQLRERVFAGQQAPVCLGDPPGWFADIVVALKSMHDAASAPARAEMLSRAQQASDARPGKLNGQPFEWLCDGDARLGPCLELMVRGNYLWVPWSRVTRIVSRPPSEIRDRLWLHAQVEFGDDGTVEAFLPARYPAPASDDHRLGRTTEWTPIGRDLYLGTGQKTLMTDAGEHGLLDVRELSFG